MMNPNLCSEGNGCALILLKAYNEYFA